MKLHGICIGTMTLALSCTIATAGGDRTLGSFDTDSEGWSTDKDARDFRWEATGGNPGGFIAADDIGSGEYWRFAAPSAYLGDRSSSYGFALSYELKQLGTVGTVTNQNDIEIVGSGMTLSYQFAVAPGGEWTAFSVDLVPGVGWMVGSDPASEAQIRSVLSDVTGLSIRGEYRVGADSCGLDNFVLGGRCTADFNQDGVLDFFDVSAFIDAYTSDDPAADLAAPFGELNFFDISAFIAVFGAGC
ncbi:MAG: laminin B domain-containing protein [Phycisphaerales bacterium JB052]